MKVLYLDGAREWSAEQDQLRLLMRELRKAGVETLCACPDNAPLANRLLRESLPVRGLKWPEGGGLGLRLEVRRLARDFDLIHARGEAALRATRFAGVPVVATRLSPQPVNVGVWKRAARLIVATDTVRALLVAAGLDETRVRVIRPGVDVEELDRMERPDPGLRARIGVPQEAFLVGAAAPLIESEQQTLIPRIAARLRDVHFVIIGEGPARKAIEAAITAHGVGPTLHLPGTLPEPRRFLHELDVFISAAAADPAGTSLLVPMAAGVPTVAADDAAAAELLAPIHVATGVALFPPGDADAAARLIARLRGDAALRVRLATEGQRRGREFTIARTMAQTLEVYRELAS